MKIDISGGGLPSRIEVSGKVLRNESLKEALFIYTFLLFMAKSVVFNVNALKNKNHNSYPGILSNLILSSVSIIKVPLFIAALFLLAFCFIPQLARAGDTLLYNNKYSVACHNCYEKKYSSSLEEALKYTSSLELDIWDSQYFIGKKKCVGTDWFVKHTLFQKGNKNCAGGSLRVCFTEIEEWTRRNPDHDVLTIYIDKKEGWGSRRSKRRPQDLDSLISSVFPENKIYSPKKVLHDNENLKSVIQSYKWPTTAELRGKVIFVITDAILFGKKNKLLDNYLNKQQKRSLCFVAPLIKKQSEISKPKGLSAQNSSNVIFYNLRYKNAGLSSVISSSNYINRVYNSPETLASVDTLEKRKVNFIALYNYKLNQRLLPKG